MIPDVLEVCEESEAPFFYSPVPQVRAAFSGLTWGRASRGSLIPVPGAVRFETSETFTIFRNLKKQPGVRRIYARRHAGC
jgi:hypothetical protein